MSGVLALVGGNEWQEKCTFDAELLAASGGSENSVMTPAGVIFPIRLWLYSVNHMFPSGPRAILRGCPPLGTGTSRMVAAGAGRAPTATSRQATSNALTHL